jgi:hypothetical protein
MCWFDRLGRVGVPFAVVVGVVRLVRLAIIGGFLDQVLILGERAWQHGLVQERLQLLPGCLSGIGQGFEKGLGQMNQAGPAPSCWACTPGPD